MNNQWMDIRKCAKYSKVFAIWIVVCLLAACFTPLSKQDSKATEPSYSASKVIIKIEGGSYIPNLSIHTAIDWKSEMTVTDSLKQSGIIKISEEDGSILSVSDVALDTKRAWGILVNGKELEQPQVMEKTVSAGDMIVLFVKQLGEKVKSPPAP